MKADVSILGELLGGMIGGFLDVGSRRPRRTPYAAYRAAWKRRRREGTSRDVLVQELKDHHVPGAYDAEGRADLRVWLQRWDRGLRPRQVPRSER